MRASKISKYTGVRLDGNKFQASIIVNNKRFYLGVFNTELEAALTWDGYVRENNLDRRLNFPDPEPDNLIPNTRLIRLTRGKFAIVDEEDFERVNQYKWMAHKFKYTWYAARMAIVNGIRQHIKMHRFILGESNLFSDHINGNGLHNYKSNLRNATHKQNQQNRRVQIGCLSSYKGVIPVRDRFRSRIRVDKKLIHIGYFMSEIEAAKAYDTAAIRYFGEFANINFKN